STCSRLARTRRAQEASNASGEGRDGSLAGSKLPSGRSSDGADAIGSLPQGPRARGLLRLTSAREISGPRQRLQVTGYRRRSRAPVTCNLFPVTSVGAEA